MKNMDKGLTAPKWVLINWLKITQMPQKFWPNLFSQAQKFGIFSKKGSLWVSVAVVRGAVHLITIFTWVVCTDLQILE